MRFEPEGVTSNPEIPFAKSMPDYIMRWLASRFLDAEIQEELGILTDEVRARKAAEEAAQSALSSDTAGPGTGPAQGEERASGTRAPNGATKRSGNGGVVRGKEPTATDEPGATGHSSGPDEAGANPNPSPESAAPASALTDSPPVVPARVQGLDLGPACSQCGGMMQRTGSCYTCPSCGHNTGCG
jgi:ribonucleoside-diphosphate reductase alpha chain